MTEPERKVPQVYQFTDNIAHYRDYYIVAESPEEAWKQSKEVDVEAYATDVTEIHTDLQRRVQPILLHFSPLILTVPQREIWIIPTHYDAYWRNESANFYGYLIEEDQVVYGTEHVWPRSLWEEVPRSVIRQRMGLSCNYFHRSCCDEMCFSPDYVAQLLAKGEEDGGQYTACYPFECTKGTICMICFKLI